MFSSKKKTSGEAAIVSRGALFRGSLETSGRLHVDGRIEGDVHVEGDISVGPDGTIVGEVHAETLTVAGAIEGEVHVKGLLRVLKGGRCGDHIFYGSLEVEKGGALSGRSAAISQDERPALPSSTDDEILEGAPA